MTVRNSYDYTWREIVQQFSRLELSYETDRLLAIGAVAEQVQTVRAGEKYLAGLWSDSLHQDLLWIKISRDNPASPTAGPSWSWASWAVGPRGVTWRELENFTNVAEIIEVECTYKEDNCFGAVLSGKLVLRSRLLECRALCVQGTIKMLLCQKVPLNISPPQDSLDFDAGLPKNGRFSHFSFHMIEIGVDESQYGNMSTRYFLILQPLDGEMGSYTRIGLARFGKSVIMNQLGKVEVCTIK